MEREEAKKLYIKYWVEWVNTTFAGEPYKEEDFDEQEGSFDHIFKAIMEADLIGYRRGVDSEVKFLI